MERQQLFAEIRSRIDAFETGIPLHKKLKMALQDLIVSNRIKRGSTLPGERAVAEALILSRVTVRKALELLIQDGHLRRRHGAKTEVSVPVEKSLSTLASFSEDMVARGLEPGCIWISKEIGRPSPAEAMALALPPNADIIRLKRIRTADGEPAAIARTRWRLPLRGTGKAQCVAPAGYTTVAFETCFGPRQRALEMCGWLTVAHH